MTSAEAPLSTSNLATSRWSQWWWRWWRWQLWWRWWPQRRPHSPQAIWQHQDIQHGPHSATQSSPPVTNIVWFLLFAFISNLYFFWGCIMHFHPHMEALSSLIALCLLLVPIKIRGPCLQRWGQHPAQWGLEPCRSGRRRQPRANTFAPHCPSPASVWLHLTQNRVPKVVYLEKLSGSGEQKSNYSNMTSETGKVERDVATWFTCCINL